MKLEDAKEKYLDNNFKLKGDFLSDGKRQTVLDKAIKYAAWTLPNIFPEEGNSDSDEMQNDYQSVGAQAVTNLANKIMMALFQPSKPFFRMQLTKKQTQEVIASGINEAELEAILADNERAAMRELNRMDARAPLTDGITHLIVTGNGIVYETEDNLQIFTLKDFLIKRDLSGKPVKIILRETKELTGLPEDLQVIALSNGYYEKDELTIYTCIVAIDKDHYLVWQELEDICYCHKEAGKYHKHDLPWIPLTWNLVRGNDYGTGLVENYSGDFHSLSTFAEAILDYSVILTDVKNLVDPAGMTDVRELTQSPSGAYVHGREEDIFTHSAKVTHVSDFLSNQFEMVSRRIGAAFLLNTAVTRNAERVTAEEIRMQAHELESSLGGVYSRLASTLQLPLARKLLKRLDNQLKNIEPVIVTGLESLSRNSELDQLRYFFQDLTQLAELPPEVERRIKFGDLIAMLGAGHGVDYKKVLKDEDQVEKDTATAMQRQAGMVGMEEQAKTRGSKQ